MTPIRSSSHNVSKGTAEMILKPIPSIKPEGRIVMILAAVCLFVGGFVILYKKEESPEPFLAFEGLPDQTRIVSTLEMTGHAEDLLLSPRNEVSFSSRKTISTPYRVRAELEIPSGGYRDLVLSLEKGRKTFTVLADGFTPYDEITLTLDNVPVYKNVPMDWSGRIELKADVPAEKPVNACLRINGRTESIGLCHVIQAEISA